MRNAVRTIPGSAGFQAHLAASVVALLSSAVPLLLAALIEAMLRPPPVDPASGPVTVVVVRPSTLWLLQDAFGWVAALSPFLAPVGLAFGVPFAVGALRRGRAGWPVACLAGSAIAFIIAAVVATLLWVVASSSGEPVDEGFGSVLIGVALSLLIGLIPGLAYWLVLRRLVPDLFEPELQAGADGTYW